MWREGSKSGDSRRWPTLDDCALYGLAGDIVHTLGPHSEADPAALLIDFLVGFGNAVGDGPHARVGATSHPARLFGCVVGETARSRKGQSHADVEAILAKADPDWAKKARVTGLASGEGLIAKLHGNPERRARVYEPEFARVLAVADRKGSILSQVLREAWDSGWLEVLTRKQPLRVTGAHVSVIAHITLEELRQRLTSTDIANGFANRFLFTCARRSKMLPEGGWLDTSDAARLASQVQKALTTARGSGELHRSRKAAALWRDIYCSLPTPGGLLGAVTARSEPQLLRLSVEYALLDQSHQIQQRHVKAAYAAWQYCFDSAQYIFGSSSGDPIAERLLLALREVYPKGLDFTQQSAVFDRHMSREHLASARASLERQRLVETRSESTRGRSRTVTFALPVRPPR
jgi:hypothetical protein